MKPTLLKQYFYSVIRASASRRTVIPSNCWKCKSSVGSSLGLFCPSCSVIQPLKADANFFDYFGLNEDFAVDQGTLRNKFRQAQSQVHPDKFGLHTEQEKKLANIHSSFANQAFKTLVDPKARAVYMLELSETDEGITDQAFAMDMLEANEEIDDSDDNVFLENKLRETQEQIDALLDSIASNFEQGKNEDARDALNQMRYFERIKKLIKTKLGML